MVRGVKVSEGGVRLIAGFEGYVGHPYRDAVGVWTIGYGHTEGVGPNSRSISQSEAEALLRHDLDRKYAPYVDQLRLPLNQNQYDALVSFVYNLGPGYITRGHTMGDALARRDWKAAADAFLLYDHAGGTRLLGLTRRRQAERALFLKPALTREQEKVAKWQAELDSLRDYIRSHGGKWHNHPIRWARAEALKSVLKRHGVKNP